MKTYKKKMKVMVNDWII